MFFTRAFSHDHYFSSVYWQGACVQKLSGKPKLEDSRATKQVVTLLSAPLEKYNDIATALTLSNYPRVMDHLDSSTNKVMAMVIIQSIMKNNTCVSTSDKVQVLVLKYSFSSSCIFEWICNFISLYPFAGWRIVWVDKRTYKGSWWDSRWWGLSMFLKLHLVLNFVQVFYRYRWMRSDN